MRAVLLFILLISFSCFAQENVSKLKVDDKPSNSVPGDVDQIITNNKLRAETGSKSRYSLATSFSYSGGAVESPFNERRPNLSAATGTTDITSMGGSISGKYSLGGVNSLFAGFGLRWMTPFEGGTPEGYNGDKFDVDNPYLNFQHLYRWFNIQSSLTLNETFYTNSNLIHAGYVTQWSASQYNVLDLGQSRWSIGANVYATYGYFDKHTEDVKAYQADYALGAVPAVEYKLTDKLNLRTDSNALCFQHKRNVRNGVTFEQQRWAQTLALGWAVTRDFYLSPGFQWTPEAISMKRTVTWLNANINVF